MIAAEVEDFAFGLFARSGQEHRFDDIIHIIQIAPLPSVAEKFDHFAIHRLPNEPRDEALPVVTHQLSRPVNIRQPQHRRAQSEEPVKEQVILFRREFVNSVEVWRRNAVMFVNRQVNGPAVKLACAGKNDSGVRIELSAGFEQHDLRGAVVVQILLRMLHRINVAQAARQIEDVIHAADQMIDQ